MRLKDYDSEQDAKRMCEELVFCCEQGHSVTVWSSDHYYPDWVECPECGHLMERELCD
jgi:hypothetical protein